MPNATAASWRELVARSRVQPVRPTSNSRAWLKVSRSCKERTGSVAT